jgi:hypothetical protein
MVFFPEIFGCDGTFRKEFITRDRFRKESKGGIRLNFVMRKWEQCQEFLPEYVLMPE